MEVLPAAIHSLPQDVLLNHVFKHLAFEELMRVVPLVCRQWKEALRLPSEVWEYLDIYLPSMVPTPSEVGTCSISIAPTKLAALVGWLQHRASSVRQLELTSSPIGMPETLTLVGPSLRHLWFHLRQDPDSSELQKLLDLLPLCSRLVTLTITGASLAGCDFSPFRELSCLTRLEFEHRRPDFSESEPAQDAGAVELPGAFFGAVQLRELVLNMRGQACHITDALSQLRLLEGLYVMQARHVAFPSSFTALGALRKLQFDDCTFNPSSRVTAANTLHEWLPACLTALTVLTRVVLRGSERMATFPAGICSLPALDTLVLAQAWDSRNPQLPVTFGRLTTLRVLQLSACELRTIPQQVFSLQGLQILRLYGNPITRLPAAISSLTNLRELQVRTADAGGLVRAFAAPLTICQELTCLQRLESLRVVCGVLTLPSLDAILPLAAITCLRHVYIDADELAPSSKVMEGLARAMGLRQHDGVRIGSMAWKL